MSSSLAIMLLKLLQTSIKHGEKAQTNERNSTKMVFKSFYGVDKSLKDEDGWGTAHPFFQNKDLRVIVEQNP